MLRYSANTSIVSRMQFWGSVVFSMMLMKSLVSLVYDGMVVTGQTYTLPEGRRTS